MGDRNTVANIRWRNRSRVLSALFFVGSQTRLDLGAELGLSAATVSNVTSDLIEAGLVHEVGQLESDGGRPRSVLAIDAERWYSVGVSIGPSRLTVGLFDLALVEQARRTMSVELADRGPAYAVDLIDGMIGQILEESGLPASRVLGAGVGVFGAVRGSGSGARVTAPTMKWDEAPLGELLSEALPFPVLLANGARNMAQAEMWLGAGRGTDDCVVVLLSSGVGAGIISSGTPFVGTGGSAGEWGHTKIVAGGRECPCGARGCLEAYVGAEVIAGEFLRRTAPERTGSSAQGTDGSAEDVISRLAAAARSGNGDGDGVRSGDALAATEVLDETAEYLGVGLANLVNLLNPERIVIGGWVGVALGDLLIDRIRSVVARDSLRPARDDIEVVLGVTGGDAAVLGAAILPVDALLRSGGRPDEALAAPAPRATVLR